MDDWRQAVVSTDQEDYWLRDVFRADPDLAFEWLRRQIDNGTVGAIRQDETIAAAVDGLSMGTKRELLISIPASWQYEELVKQLVGDDIGLYQVLLDRADMERFHLTPLVGYPDEGNWAERAIMALDHEYLPEKIALAVHGVGVMTITWSGDESVLWDEWMNRFASLRIHQDERIRYIGEIGQNRMVENRKRALEEERFDLGVWRRAWFDPPMQRLLAFLRSDRFAARAGETGGYDLSGAGTIHHNGASG